MLWFINFGLFNCLTSSADHDLLAEIVTTSVTLYMPNMYCETIFDKNSVVSDLVFSNCLYIFHLFCSFVSLLFNACRVILMIV